ncbi:MAG: CDC27 family protein [Bacteroidota bacterium]
MKNKLLFGFLVLSMLFASAGYAQKADELYKQAIAIMDSANDFKGAIVLLDKAIKLEPKNSDYQYEKAYAYYHLEEYKTAAKLLEKIMDAPASGPVYYQLLANAYNKLEEVDKSDKTYEKGLEKYPYAGLLYSGQGINKYNRKEYDAAVTWFEKGIENAPAFPSNYFYAASLYAGSSETVWAVMYGELFCNIERTSGRTEKMSKLLYDTYSKSITFKDSSIAVSFTQNATISINDLNDFKLPFANSVFEMNYLLSLVGEKEINLATLNRIRTKFIEMYFSKDQSKNYPNVLFDFHKQLISKNYFDCYNYWLFYYGNESEADAWITNNKDRFEQFLKWFSDNPLDLSKDKQFYRFQYK